MVKETAYYEAKRIATQLDKIYDSDMTNRLVASLASPSYTLKEIEALAREWVKSQEGDIDMLDWTFSIWLEWLARREREGLNVDKKS